MGEQILQTVAEYGLETAVLALAINLLTALVKLPVKRLANKTKNGANITRFIVFLPILLGFALSALYTKVFAHGYIISKEFTALWLTSSSLSLTFYAVFEKLVPPKNKEESAAELAASKELLNGIQSALNNGADAEKTGEENDGQENNENTDETGSPVGAPCSEKIILRGKRND